MFITELFESSERQVLVIYPGRFQPFHKGHAAVYDHLCKKYGIKNVYIITSNKVEPPKSPFSFEDKKLMMELTGVDPKHIVYDAQPYQAKNFVANFDPSTILLFAISEKDMAEDPRFQFKQKKDGSPSYFQPLKNLSQCESLEKHAYITTVPTFNFTVLGKPANSATQIRNQFANANEPTQKKIVADLFGRFDTTVFDIMQSKLSSGVNKEITESVDSDIQIYRIQEKYKVTRKEATEMYYVMGIRIKKDSLSKKKESDKKINEEIIHTAQFKNFNIKVDDHYLLRSKQRKVGHAEVGRVIAKFPKIEEQLQEIPPSQQFWVFDDRQNVALGMRKLSDINRTMQLILKTVVRGDPPEQGRTPIITIS